MKKLSLLICFLFGTAPLAPAQMLDFNFNGLNEAIPDGDLSGLADTHAISTGFASIADLDVTLSLSGTGAGGFNGDIYAYLVHDNALAVLLNRPGVRAGNTAGYSDSGFSAVTFDDAASNGDVHQYRLTLAGNQTTPVGSLTGSWAPDGRNVHPLSVLETSPRTAMLSSFNGLSPDGTWTLFVADTAAGGTMQLDSWSLQITAIAPVPEPGQSALLAGLGVGAFAAWRRFQKRRTHQVVESNMLSN